MKLMNMLPVFAVLALSACSDKAMESQLERVLEKNPDLVMNVISKNPEKFMQAAQTASRAMQEKMQSNQRKQMEDNMEADLKTPQQVPYTDAEAVGKKDAKVVVVEYSDLQCPYCSRGYATLEEVKKLYPDSKVVFKQRPLPMHQHARPAALYYLAVQRSHGAAKAYEFGGAVFAKQQEMNQVSPADLGKFLDKVAKSVGVNVGKVNQVLKSEKASLEAKVESDSAEASKLGFNGTPAFVVNGVRVNGAVPVEVFKSAVEKTLNPAKAASK
jgi:protein-disulfide isomerase